MIWTGDLEGWLQFEFGRRISLRCDAMDDMSGCLRPVLVRYGNQNTGPLHALSHSAQTVNWPWNARKLDNLRLMFLIHCELSA